MGRPAKKTEQPTRVGSTLRTTATIVSMTAALVSIATFARAWGLYGGPAHSYLTIGAFGARWVGIKPELDSAFALGDTIVLAATVTGKNGNNLVGATIGWSSDDPSVATVSDEGIVIARSAGSTTIVASVGSLAARSRVHVRPKVTYVRIAGDSAVTVYEGERAELSVRAGDARGHVMRDKRAQWTSADSAIAIIDSAGHIVGIAPGRTTVTAVIDGVSAQAPVTVAPVPGSLALLGGGDQRARAGATLPLPVAVRVFDRRGQAIAGVPVRFRDPAGGGTFEPAIVFSDLDGHARSTWTLSPVPGRQRAIAMVDHVDSSLVVVAEAEPVAENLRIIGRGPEQRGTAGEPLAEPIAVRLTDSTGLPLVDVPVSWHTEDGGTLEATAARTDSLGEARARWTLGKRARTQTATVRVGKVGTIPAHAIDVLVAPGAPATLALASGNAQRVTVSSAPKRAIVLRVTDALENPIPGIAVRLAASAGTLVEKELLTDSTGRATVQWTLGRSAGVQRLTARAAGIAKPLEVGVTAVPAAPANITFAELPATALVSRRLADTVWVTVTDGFGNPVPNAPVVFAAKSGTLTTTRAMTDDRGRAATRWTLGRTAGDQTVTATVRGTDVKAARVVRARAPAPAKPAVTRPEAASPASTAAAPSSLINQG